MRSQARSISLCAASLCAALLSVLAGCGAPMDEAALDADPALTRSALWGFDRFLYLRCSSTSFELTDKSRFRATADPEVFRIPLEVREPWMLSSGESCVVTETSTRDAWSGDNRELGTTASLTVPATAELTAGAGMFRVRYPDVGRFEARINVRTWAITFGILEEDERWRPAGDDAKITVVTSGLRPSLQGGALRTRTLVGLESGSIFETFEGNSTVPRWTRKDRWTNAAGEAQRLPNSAVTSIAIDPVNDAHALAAFAGVRGGPKVFITSDAGATWEPLRTLPLAEVWGISFNPLRPNVAYAIGAGSAAGEVAAFASSDGGRTWQTTVENDPLLPPGSTGRISAVSVVGPTAAIWIGTSKGELWARSPGQAPATFTRIDTRGLPQRAITRITPSTEAVQPPEVYVTFAGLHVDNVWATRNGGAAWQSLHTNPVPTFAAPNDSLAAFGISVNPANTNELFLFVTDATLRSLDRGLTWK